MLKYGTTFSLATKIFVLYSLWTMASLADTSNATITDGRSEIVVTDERGTGFTDFRMLYRQIWCIERTPKLDRKTLHNAKLACQAIGGRLPKLSEVDSLASYISENYYLNIYDNDKSVLKSRFLDDDRFFWTETLKRENYVYRRALASLYRLENSADQSKAKVEWALTSDDDREHRPYLCVFPK